MSAVVHALVAELAALSDEQLAPLVERLAELLRPAAEPDASPLMTAGEAATFLRCDRRRIYALVSDGRLSRRGDGRRLLLYREEVRQLATR